MRTFVIMKPTIQYIQQKVDEFNRLMFDGKLFRSIMESINTKFGRHLTISHKCTAEQREQAVDKRKKLHAIAFVRFHDGKCGVKVLPRMAKHNKVSY